MRKVIFILISLFIAASCQIKHEMDACPQEIQIDWPFTRSLPSGINYTDSTFRVVMFSSADSTKVADGSYCLPNAASYTDEYSDGWLTPCSVKEVDGHYIYGADDRNSGLIYKGNGYNYLLAVASPAVPIEKYAAGCWGFHQDRIVGSCPERADRVYFTSAFKAPLSSYFLGNKYVYELPDDIILKEHRSRIKVLLMCSEDLETAIVNAAQLTNAIGSAYYRPVTEDYEEDGHVIEDPVTLFDVPVTINYGDEPYIVCDGEYLFSEDYSAKEKYYDEKGDEGLRYVYTVPRLEFNIADRICKVPLGINMLPQYEYIIKVIVSSVYAKVELTAVPWDTGFGYDEILGIYPSLELGYFEIQGWEDGHGGEGIIS